MRGVNAKRVKQITVAFISTIVHEDPSHAKFRVKGIVSWRRKGWISDSTQLTGRLGSPGDDVRNLFVPRHCCNAGEVTAVFDPKHHEGSRPEAGYDQIISTW